MKGNDFVAFLLRTPLYVFMGDTMLITVTGRKSGRKYTTPVGFFAKENNLWVITSRDRTWWRNIKTGADVSLHLRGRNVTGFAEVVLDEAMVGTLVGDYLRRFPMAARSLGVRVEKGVVHAEDAARVAKERLFVRICVKKM